MSLCYVCFVGEHMGEITGQPHDCAFTGWNIEISDDMFIVANCMTSTIEYYQLHWHDTMVLVSWLTSGSSCYFVPVAEYWDWIKIFLQFWVSLHLCFVSLQYTMYVNQRMDLKKESKLKLFEKKEWRFMDLHKSPFSKLVPHILPPKNAKNMPWYFCNLFYLLAVCSHTDRS